MNFGAKLLIYIDLTKHFTHFLHQNAIFIRAILHQNTIFHYELLHQNTIFEIFAYLIDVFSVNAIGFGKVGEMAHGIFHLFYDRRCILDAMRSSCYGHQHLPPEH